MTHLPAPVVLDAHQEQTFVPLVVADGPQASPQPAQPPRDTSREAAIAELLRGKPLESYAALMVLTADSYGVDWHLLPVISILESSGGLNACGGNAWGWGSCRLREIGSFAEGIDVVAHELAGPTYAGQSPDTQLCIWVSGHGCYGQQALNYQAKAMVLWVQLDAARERLR